MSYKDLTFKDLGYRRKITVRKKIRELWAKGLNATEISKKVRISSKSVATAMGNLTRYI